MTRAALFKTFSQKYGLTGLKSIHIFKRSLWNDSYIPYLNVHDIKISKERDSYTAHYRTQGLSLESFNQYGNPRLQSLLINMYQSRLYIYNVECKISRDHDLDWEKITSELDQYSDRSLFLSSTEATFADMMYDPILNKKQFDVKVELGYFGNSSVTLVSSYFEKGKLNAQPPLLYIKSQSVSVSKKTGKALPYPDWFKDKLEGKGILDKGLILPTFERPDKTYVFEVKVRWNDTDSNNHTNSAAYISFAEDAIYDALVHNDEAVGELTRQDFIEGCKKMQISWKKESYRGERLQCHVWDEGGTTKVSIERDDIPRCQAILRYRKADVITFQ